MKRAVLKILIWYKRYVSWGYACRFVPSCSEYAYEAVEKYGVFKGSWMALKRIAKCHPWSKGGKDLVE